MKLYEAQAEHKMLPTLPTFARVDGRAFHSFTKGMERPYDARMMQAMQMTALALATETNARMTYTQSDEITLAWLSEDARSQIWFDGRHSKMVSNIAALAALHFYRACVRLLPLAYAERLPSFDARVWQVPNKTEGANVFLWREWDATKNSITMAASAYYSHNELHGKNGAEKQEMLFQKGVNWNDYPSAFKRGTFIQRKVVSRPLAPEDLEELPEKHHARQNPDLVVERAVWRVHNEGFPPLAQCVNREAVVFDAAEPETAQIRGMDFELEDGLP